MRSFFLEGFAKGNSGLRLGARTLPCLLTCFLLVAPGALAQTLYEKLQRAEKYFGQARAAYQILRETPPEARTLAQYTQLIRDFRRVYLTAPTYANNTVSLMAIGDLYQGMGRKWQEQKYFQSAIEAYEFLLREYPHSQYRFEARLTAARIFREELRQLEKALEQYERYLKAYPGSPQAKDARQAAEEIRQEMAAQTQPAEEKPPAVAAVAEKPPPTSRPANFPKITNIRSWATPSYTRVVIDVEEEVKYEVARLGNPPRLYIDLHDTQVGREVSGKTFSVQYELLKQVRAGQYRAEVARVVLDLGDITEYSVFDLPNPYRLVIDVHSRPSEALAASKRAQAAPGGKAAAVVSESSVPSVPSAVPVGAKNQEKAGSSPSPSVAVAGASPAELAKAAESPAFKPAQPNRDGSHSLTRALGLKIGRIILDPGHGGHDTGTIGPSGLTEKALVLDIARQLGKLIMDRLGSEVIYTRTDDTFVPLESRTALANKMQADLFVSIHANSSKNRSARGVETYYLNFTTDPEALEVAARENAVSQETISQLQGLVRKIALQDKIDESKEFATRVQSALRAGVLGSKSRQLDRGVKKAPFVVLIGANMPSILAEVSFLSNPQDEKLLKTEEHRQKIAESLYAGIEGYIETLSGVKVAQAEPTQTASLE